MRILLIILLIGNTTAVFAQTQIKGTVKDVNGNTIPGANVYVKGGFDGATTDANGSFDFKTGMTGNQTLVVSFIGFETFEKAVLLKGQTITEIIILKETASQIEAVTVTAGSFEASDEKKAVALKPLDIVSVASSIGDIMGAMATLPGAQRSGSDGYLIVRGGDAAETKTFIDGSYVEKPYTSHMPDLPSRGRFSPMLFKGTMFSTGGYSAQYGQALSSVLQLETSGIATEDQTAISLMSVGLGASITRHRDSVYSFSSEAGYYSMSPYYNLTGSNISWTQPSQSVNSLSTFRRKIGKSGLLKTMFQLSGTSSGMLYRNLDKGFDDSLTIKNGNVYVNSAYQTTITKDLSFGIGSGLMFDNDNLKLEAMKLNTANLSASFGLWTKYYLHHTSIKAGVQIFAKNYTQTYDTDTLNATMKFNQPVYAGYIEFEHSLSKQWAVKHGYRYEYSSQNKEQTLSPRISAAYKINEISQLSCAWGIFRQLQGDDYVKFNGSLASSQALQYIVNYQVQKNGRLFRSELYYKDYSKLITYKSLNNADASSYSTSGFGNAKGLDVFYRDTKTVRDGDFWVSYSYINTQRKYKDYVSAVRPDYVSPHSASIVYKQFFPKIQTQFGVSYTYANGKKYNNPNEKTFMSGTLNDTHDLSLSFSYIRRLWGKLMIIHGSLSNVLGIENVYGYRYSSSPDNNGVYASQAIVPVARRMFFIGAFINL